MTTNFDLAKLCKFYKLAPVHITSVDVLGSLAPRKYTIINADDSSGPGTHWTCVYEDRKRMIVYDPFGLPTDPRIIDYCKRFKKQQTISITNDSQDLSSSNCGQWCIFFLFSMKHNVGLAEFLASLSSDTMQNEAMLSEFFAH